jgi:hypothetical protein
MRNGERAAARFGFKFDQLQLFDPLELLTDRQLAILEVDVLPAKSQDFRLPQSQSQGKRQERFQAVLAII